MRKYVLALTLVVAVVGGVLGPAFGQTNLQANATASATDTQTVGDIQFYPGNRIAVSPSDGSLGLTLQSGLESVIDDEAMTLDFVFGSQSGKISASVNGGTSGGTEQTNNQLLSLLGESVSDASDGMQLFLCEDRETFSEEDCEPLMTSDFSAFETVDVVFSGSSTGQPALLPEDGVANVSKEDGPSRSLKLAAKTIGNGPSEAFDNVTIDVVFTIQDN